MAEFPEGLTLRTVTGSVDPGTEVILRIPQWLIGPTDDLIYRPRDLKPTLAGDGSFTIDVPVNDDGSWSAFQYYVRFQSNGRILKGAMDVPSGVGSVDVADQIIVGTPPTGAVDYLDATDIGARVAGFDEDGNVLDGNGDPVTGGGGGGGAVASVNGETGVVVLSAADVGADATGAASAAVAAHTAAGDPHPQYLTTAEGSAAYDASGAASTAVAAHVAAGDPHPQYLTAAEGNAAYQPVDADLTAIGNLTPTNDDVVQRKAGVWTNRTPGQLKTDLALTKSDVGLGSADNTSDASKPLSTAAVTALAGKADLVGGLVPTSQIPALAITEVFTAANQAAMLALTAQRGDMAVRTDTGHRFILSSDSPGTLADWIDLGTATDGVASVNGQVGIVVLAKGDVGLGNVDNTSDATKALTASQITSGTFAIGRIPTGTSGTTVPFGNDSRFSDSRTPTAHAASHASGGGDPITVAESQVTGLVSDLAGKQPLDSDLTTIAGLTPTTNNFMVGVASAWGSVTPAAAKTALGITETDVANLTTDLAAKAPLASPALTGTPTAPTATAGTSTTQLATTAFATGAIATALSQATASIVRPLPYRRGSTIVTHAQSGHGWTLLNGTGTLTANATDDFVFGTQSIKLVTAGTATWSRVGKNAGTAVNATGKAVRVWLKTTNSNNAGTVTVYAGTGSGSAFYSWDITQTAWNSANQYHLPDATWACFTLSFSHAAVTGSPTRSALTDFSFAVTDNTVAATVWFGGMEVFTESTKYSGAVTICFDDSFTNQWSLAKPIMDAAGFQGTLFPIVDVVGTGGFLTAAQIKIFQDMCGWEVAPHAFTTSNHTNYGSLTAAQIQADMLSNLNWMGANGLRNWGSYAYPLGYFSGGQMEAVGPYCNLARTIQNRHNSNTLPVAKPERVWSVSGVGGSGGYAVTNLTNASGLLDQVVTDKAWVVLTFHDFTAGTSGSVNVCSTTDFQTLITSIVSKGLTVLTMAEAAAAGAFTP